MSTDTVEKVTAKQKELECWTKAPPTTIYNFVEGDNGEKFKTSIVSLAQDSFEFNVLRDCVQNTH